MNLQLTEALRIADMSFGTLAPFLAGHGAKQLVFSYAGRTIQPGYHITEVKAGTFATLDCGGNPDEWHEVILQLEDLPAKEGSAAMSVAKFQAILARCEAKLQLAGAARLTIEIGRPGEAMMVHDIGDVKVTEEVVHVELVPRSAICKPRHRVAADAASACCNPKAGRQACCA